MSRLVMLTDEECRTLGGIEYFAEHNRTASAKLCAALDRDPDQLVETIARAIHSKAASLHPFDRVPFDQMPWRGREYFDAQAWAVIADLTEETSVEADRQQDRADARPEPESSLAAERATAARFKATGLRSALAVIDGRDEL